MGPAIHLRGNIDEFILGTRAFIAIIKADFSHDRKFCLLQLIEICLGGCLDKSA
jgi:hypothetical protein